MKRFFFEDEDDEEGEDEMMGRPMPEFVPEFFAMNGEDPNRYILEYSLKVCEKTLFWRFRTVKQKTDLIGKVFSSLKNMMDFGPSDPI